MAEAVPVCDALCEAIEYLSRLGSNLRVRSENFKQKKLRKDRLRNTHAVQKAANKVLLICELSKKSILNVEDGVRQILTQIDAAQGSNKFKKNVQESTREIVYEYFEYDSQRLKIRNKINLKHFTSVKVLTKAMPLSMLNDYPLYYACNLHHLREERDKQKSDDHQLTEIEKLNNSNDEDHSEVTDKSNNIEKSDSTPTKQKDHVENTEIKKKSLTTKHKKYKHIKVVDDDSADSNYNVDNLQTNENIVHDNDTGNTEIVNVSSTNKENNMDEENIQQSSNVEDTVLSESVHVSGEQNTSECSSARRDTKGDKKNAEDTSLDTTEKLDTDMIDTTKINREDQMSSHSDKDTNDSKIEINNINMDVEKCVNTSLLNDLHTVSNDVPNKNIAKESNSETKSNSDDNSHCSTDSKPLIKCVNINKLLRKDKIPKTKESVIEILDSDTDDEITVKNKKHRHRENSKKYKLRRKSKLSLIKCTKDSITHRDSYPQISDDEDFWKNKRKEVKKFKPKQFTVNIVRMPKLTEHFLYKYNLNKIIQNGSIVCEIPIENGNTGLKQHKSNTQLTIESKSSENKSIKEVNVVKHRLLNDSGSDCEKETVNCNDLKKALLNESDILDEQEKAKSEESGDDKNSDKSMHKDNQKSATLSEQESQNTNDSSDTNSKSKKRKRKSISPLVSKRKRIMKSVHAKKMLLNCSTSSDTEDEVVKDVLKNIKDSLLRGESDEDIEMKQNSGSDGEVTKSNLNQINSESDISSKDTNSQKNTEVNSEMVRNIERAKSEGSEDDENSEKSINKDKIQSKISSEQESENNNDSSKSPSLSKQKHIKRSVHAKKNLLNYSSSSDTEDEGVRNALKNIKDCLLKGESDEDIEKKSGSDGEVTKSNTRSSQGRSNSECDISTKGTNSQGNEVDTNSSSEKVRH